jgi:hypothetical protein
MMCCREAIHNGDPTGSGSSAPKSSDSNQQDAIDTLGPVNFIDILTVSTSTPNEHYGDKNSYIQQQNYKYAQ